MKYENSFQYQRKLIITKQIGIFNKLITQIVVMKDFYKWAYDHSQNDHPKYASLSHSLYITISGTMIILITSLFIRYLFFDFDMHPLRPQAPYFAIFFLIYLGFMMVTRYSQNGSIAIYQFIWACNESMLLAAIGLITGDSVLIRICLVVVSIDQILWYIDIIGFLIKRKFYVGVAKYIIWPQTSKLRLLTTFHHIWFLPLCLWLIHPSSQYSQFDGQVYLMACIICFILASVGRNSTPKEIKLKPKGKKQERVVYMNLNLSWELWKDVKINFLQYLYKVVPSQLIPLVIAMFWSVGSLAGWAIFGQLQRRTK